MLKRENIDVNNMEAINYLKNNFIQFLEKQREYLIEIERKNLNRINHIKDDWNKIKTPEEKAKTNTIFNNIIFFLGSLVAPEITPSELFGKAKEDPKSVEQYNNVKELGSQIVKGSRKLWESSRETIIAINKAMENIKNNDEALIELIDQIGKQYDIGKKNAYPLIYGLVNCGYYDINKLDTIIDYNPFVFKEVDNYFARLEHNYINLYGNNVIQKGR